MGIAQNMVNEMLHEAEATRKVLGRIPDALLGWKPHEKSSSMGMLASHLADIAGWTVPIVTMDQLEMARVSVLKGMVLNHSYHHRGQLSVYLRLNDIPVPAIYGPSADEQA